jgi:hypothetical protein
MALARAAGLYRLALRTQWEAVRVLSHAAAGGELPAAEQKPLVDDLEAARVRSAPAPRVPRSEPLGVSLPSRQQVALNKALMACGTVRGVLALVAERVDVLNCVNVSTALLAIQRRRSERETAEWLKGDASFRSLLKVARRQMERDAMDPQALSNVLYVCGELGTRPPPSWMAVYWDASAVALESFVPQALSNTMYACHKLELTPPPGWLARYWEACAAKVGEFNAQDCSNTVYACGQLGIRPPDFWLERFWVSSAGTMASFIVQDLCNTLYACGLLSVTPPADWMTRYWAHTAAKLGEFEAQHFSSTLYTCRQLGVTPPPDWLLRFSDASSPKLSTFEPQALTIMVSACAQLDAKPPAAWMLRFSDAYELALPCADNQDCANTSLALAMLAAWELPVWRSLWEHVCGCLPRDSGVWTAENILHARQLYQAYQAAETHKPGLLPAPSPELLAAARQAWVGQVLDDEVNVSSKLHADVSQCLTRMGVPHANEHWCERAERSIDIAIEGMSMPVALEVDGPHHFLQDGRPDGSTLLRNRMLAANGWRVVVVDHRLWRDQPPPDQEQYLRRLLA